MKFSLPIFLSLLCVSLSHAQDAPPAPGPGELSQLRQQARQQTITASATLTEQYIKALAALEQEAAASGDYERALQAQQRRGTLAQIQSLATLANGIVLKPSQARLVGAVSHDSASDTLGPWRSASNSATWDVTKITPGVYEVIVTYAVAPFGTPSGRNTPGFDARTGGEFEFFEVSNLAGASQNRRTSVVTNTGGWNNFKTATLGTFQLTRTTASFCLRITRANGDGGVMHVKDVRLNPAVASPTLTQDTPSDPVNTLHEVYQLKLKAIATPIISSYIEAIQTRLNEANASTGNPTETITELQAELDRATKWMDRPLSPGRARAALSLFDDAEEEWTNVTYVGDEANTGDRFLIEHQGQKIPVRLKTVTCPPPSDEAVGELQHYAAYFHINPEQALIIGKQAREFTSATLANKPLRLLTNGQKDRDGRLRVTLYLPHLGDYAGMLVDNGLAAITPPPGPRRNGTPVRPDPGHAALQQREIATRTRANPPGAWAFSDPPSSLP